MTYKTGNLPKPFPRYGVSTTIFNNNGVINVFYHRTNVFAYDGSSHVTLNTGGYSSRTTKARINAAFIYAGLPGYHVFQRDYTWYLSCPNNHTTLWPYSIMKEIDIPQGVNYDL